ncbi:hypothetical protein [Acinetobacter nectaris]|uniref:hypothetical protein n=1 Tax=Acinetobacter nectaris TaxID=1219382 RepID=UPI001F2D12EB|nr:hypothetical protein [Acinetobacter nectaris]MCF9047271.1 hypothetical protein [Acinetobacter nectaris]
MSDPINYAEKPARVLLNYIDQISDAVFFNQSGFVIDAHNKFMLEALNHAELGYYNIENNSFQLHNIIINFVNFYKKRKVINNSKMINQILEEIKQSTSDFIQAKLDTPESIDLLKQEIIDLIITLSNTIHESSYNFAILAMHDLTLFNNLKLRIKRITRHIGVVNELLAVHGILSHSEMIKLAVADIDLEQAIRLYLMPVFHQSKIDLIDSLRKLEQQLFEWKQEEAYQRQNNMIDAWIKFCQQNATIHDDVDIHDIPDAFYRLPNRNLTNRADISCLTETLVDINTAVMKKAQSETQILQKKSDIALEQVIIQNEVIIKEESRLEIALNHFFEALTAGKGHHSTLDALSTFTLLSPDCEMDYWANSLVMCCRNDYAKKLKITFIEEIDPIFNGNSRVINVVISRIGA